MKVAELKIEDIKVIYSLLYQNFIDGKEESIKILEEILLENKEIDFLLNEHEIMLRSKYPF